MPNKVGRTKKICEICGKQFDVYPRLANSRRYCSRECFSKAPSHWKGIEKKPRIIKTCPNCNGQFSLIPFWAERFKFCSTKCAAEFLRKGKPSHNRIEHVTVNCEICGNPIDATPKRAKRTRYCSKECFYESKRRKIGEDSINWNGGISYSNHNTIEWNLISKKTKVRDKNRCTKCGMTSEQSINIYGKSLHVHHIVPFGLSEDNSQSNLRTLCVACHTKLEHAFAWLL